MDVRTVGPELVRSGPWSGIPDQLNFGPVRWSGIPDQYNLVRSDGPEFLGGFNDFNISSASTSQRAGTVLYR